MNKEESDNNAPELDNLHLLVPDPDCIYCEGKGACFCGPCPCLHLPENDDHS